MEINKIYCKLDENNTIQGYFICFAKEPKYKTMGCEFDESIDFENAVVISPEYLDKIHVGYSQVIGGEFIENKEEYENSQKKVFVEPVEETAENNEL